MAPRALTDEAWLAICEAARLIPDAEARAELSAGRGDAQHLCHAHAIIGHADLVRGHVPRWGRKNGGIKESTDGG
jgi:hypothetical protein